MPEINMNGRNNDFPIDFRQYQKVISSILEPEGMEITEAPRNKVQHTKISFYFLKDLIVESQFKRELRESKQIENLKVRYNCLEIQVDLCRVSIKLNKLKLL